MYVCIEYKTWQVKYDLFGDKILVFDKGTSNLISIKMPVDNNNIEFEGCNGCYLWQPKKGYLNITLGNLSATQPIALLIWPPLLIESD